MMMAHAGSVNRDRNGAAKTSSALKVAAVAALAAALVSPPAAAWGQGAPAGGAPAVAGIVERMVAGSQQRAARLRGYTDQRQYRVTYHGFPTALTASMTVEAVYEAPATKRFHIVARDGSPLLIHHVLQRLLDSEQEAARDPDRTALAPANYTFTLMGRESVAGRPCYVLHVEPKRNSKFLYRGKVYVAAEDYAVVQIDAEPAKNPSMWIQKTEIHHVYGKFGQFWLPEQDRSRSTLRMGTAELTIDYGQYTVQTQGSERAVFGNAPGNVASSGRGALQ